MPPRRYRVSAVVSRKSATHSPDELTVKVHNLFSLKDKTAVVTGASNGLGARMARVLDAAGASIALVGRRATSLEKVAETLRNEHFIFPADLVDTDSIADIVSRCRSELPAVDVLVNNAGVFISSSLQATSLDQWENMQQVNLRAPFLLAQALADDMARRGAGKIINMSSIMGLVGDHDSAGYSASKAGVIGLTRSLAVTLGDTGVQVNALCPGFIATSMTEALQNNVRFKSRLEQRVPLRRWGSPEDLDGSILFLSSAASDFVTGQVFVVDGGLLAGW